MLLQAQSGAHRAFLCCQRPSASYSFASPTPEGMARMVVAAAAAAEAMDAEEDSETRAQSGNPEASQHLIWLHLGMSTSHIRRTRRRQGAR